MNGTKRNSQKADALHDVGAAMTRKRSIACKDTYMKILSHDSMCPSNRQANDAPAYGVLDTHDYRPQPK